MPRPKTPKELLVPEEADHVVIFTDGACLGNPGPGGYGAFLRFQGKERKVSGGEEETTNNRMELMAVIKALESLKRDHPVIVNSPAGGLGPCWCRGWC